MEENMSMYEKSIKQIEADFNKKTARKIINKFKEQRKKFEIMSSPLYFNIKHITLKITKFVNIEKEIFYEFENLNEKKKQELLRRLNEKLKELEYFGTLTILEMRKELMRR
jgi:hypothetical protein